MIDSHVTTEQQQWTTGESDPQAEVSKDLTWHLAVARDVSGAEFGMVAYQLTLADHRPAS